MRLLYFIDFIHTSGGMERVLTLKANYLAEILGYEVGIVVLTEPKEAFYPLHPSIKLYFLGLNQVQRNTTAFQKIFFKKYFSSEHFLAVQKLIDEQKPDICISMFGNELYFLHSIKDKSKKLIEFHSSKQSFIIQANQGKLAFIKKIYREQMLNFVTKNLKEYDKFVCLTKKDYEAWGKLKNSMNIYNPNTFKISNDFTIDYSVKKVLSVGGIAFSKAYELMVDAWGKVHQKFPAWQLEIVGRRNVEDNLDEYINTKGLSSVIKVLPVTNDILKHYQSSSIYVSSSRFEGFPMALLEASSCGLPLVSFDCPTGPSEIIEAGKTGFLARYLDTEDLANKLMLLIKDKNKREQMGRAAKTSMEKYSINLIMDQWNQLFLNISSH